MPQRDSAKCRPRSRLVTWFMVLALGLGIRTSLAATPGVIRLAPGASNDEIQRALDTLPPNGEVLLGPGQYEISQPLMLRRDYATLRGSGPSTVLHLANGADCPVVILGPPMTQTKRPAGHLCLADLFIDGNRQHQKVELWRFAGDGSEFNNNGVQIWNVTDSVVDHVTCCRCRSGGLVTASVRRLQINDFAAYDNQFDGLACYQTEECRFNHLSLHDNLAAGISLDLCFNHNFITNAALADNDLGIFMRDSRGNSFQRLMISKCHHHGVFMAETAVATAKGWQLSPATACIGNHFDGLTVNDCGGKAFQVNDAACTDNAISGARFLRNTLGGLGEPADHLINVCELAGR